MILDENLDSIDLEGTVEEVAEAIIKRPKLITLEHFELGYKPPEWRKV